MKLSATTKLSSNYTCELLIPTWHALHISNPHTHLFCFVLFFLHSLLWSMTKHHNGIWPDQVCRKGSRCQNTGSCRRRDGSVVVGGKKSAVCNRMFGLSCLIAATWDWMQQHLHPCAKSLRVCYFCREMQRSFRIGLIQYSPPFFPPIPLCLQPSRATPGSSWRCRLRSAPSARRGATPSAAASASTNGIPCLLDLVAWQPRWKTAPAETTGSPATGVRAELHKNPKQNQKHLKAGV